MVSTPVRVLAFVVVVLLLAAGLIGFGRLSDDAGLSMGLTTVWIGLVFVAAAVLAWRRRRLLVPLGLGFAVFTVAAFVWVLIPTLTDKEVNERVVTGAPASQAREGEPAGGQPAAGEAPPQGNVQLAAGQFQSIAHSGSGSAAVVELANGDRVVTLTRFATDSGPDLRLYLATGDPAGGGELGDFVDLGDLKGNKGNQQYKLPKGVDLDSHGTVVVWCRAFSVAFTSAALERS